MDEQTKIMETSTETEAPKEPIVTKLDAAEINARNAAMSTGNVADDGQGAAFFTAADVRAMTREQVRRNLAKIHKSMESDKF